MNKAFTFFFVAVFAAAGLFAQDASRLSNAQVIAKNDITHLPNFIKMKTQVRQENFVNWAVYSLGLPNNSTFKAYDVQKDELGFTHTRHKQYVNDIPVEASMLISHGKNGSVQMMNGDYYLDFSASTTAGINEQQAFQLALKKVNAKKYMWENSAFARQTGEDMFPKGELVYVHKKNKDYAAENMRLAYKFNIYAEVPLYRANVFVDANTGEILDEQNLICTIDVIGTANTQFSGTQTMTSDSTGPGAYRLQETGRGNGIETYNLQNGTTYQNTDFTNNSSNWNITGADQCATDAHWGAEMTYDYFKNIHNRNSIDGNGFTLKSYVHYSTNFINAFWDGQRMTYGDGNINAGYYPLICLDIVGHEITHGLTNFTANLGNGEAGALNESFSDIFGASIEVMARPTQNDWILASEITVSGNGFRNMANPKSLGQPDTYLGINWDPNGQVHNNDGPCNYWFYLLCQGGSGTNDNADAYNVTGITMTKAEKIAFRGLTVYFTPNTNYAAARMYTIQASTDLFGLCSPEFIATTDAWYAVGVGAAFSPSVVTPAFTNSGVTCAVPMTVTFSNVSQNAASYYWSFGDGDTSTSASPVHTYTAAGTYVAKLVATSCSGIKDSTSKTLTIGAAPVGTFFSEGFETVTLPGPEWSLASAGQNWAITSAAAATGTNSAMIDNFSNQAGNTSTLESVSYDISGMTTPKLTFKMAYRQRASTDQDKLQIQSSIDCGANWTPRWTRTGSILATVTPPDATPFFPGSGQFTTYTVNINALIGKNNVRFRFNFTADTGSFGNNIFIDDINLFDATIGVQQYAALNELEIFPNPSEGNVNIEFSLSTEKKIAITMTDVLGRTVEFLPAQNFGIGGSLLTIGEKNKYSPGVYFVNLDANGEVITKKIVIR